MLDDLLSKLIIKANEDRTTLMGNARAEQQNVRETLGLDFNTVYDMEKLGSVVQYGGFFIRARYVNCDGSDERKGADPNFHYTHLALVARNIAYDPWLPIGKQRLAEIIKNILAEKEAAK